VSLLFDIETYTIFRCSFHFVPHLTHTIFQYNTTEQFEEKLWPKYSRYDGKKVNRFYLLLKHFRFTQLDDGSYYNGMFCKGNVKECILLSRNVFNKIPTTPRRRKSGGGGGGTPTKKC
jgi:hypothetical protein